MNDRAPLIWLCDCGHAETDHRESFIGKFPCRVCACDDFGPDFATDFTNQEDYEHDRDSD